MVLEENDLVFRKNTETLGGVECAETQKERGRQNVVEVLVGRSERRDAQDKEHTDRGRDCAEYAGVFGSDIPGCDPRSTTY